MDHPYLSIVTACRNDNHGGNLLHRMQLFVNGLLHQCDVHQLDAELVLVEWNPPVDRPRLAEALRWPANNRLCQVRVIEVPAYIHRRFKYSDKLPLFQMIGKNVGIRRALGEFVLATNIDILLSSELVRFLASCRLRTDRMYRIDRYDVPSDIRVDASIVDQLEYCRRHVMRIHARKGTRNLQSGNYHSIYGDLTWRGWLQEKMRDWGMIRVTQRSRLHTNACGDFTLMAREHWFALRGYPEFETYSFHLDSVLCHAAHHGGVREEVLRDPMRVYHIEHGPGSGWTPEGQKKLNQRLEVAGIPQVDHDVFDRWAIQMRSERTPMIFNSEKWGLAEDDLPETVVAGARDAK